MSLLRTLKKLLFGETWILPLGIATALLVAAAATSASPAASAAVLTASVILTLLTSVARSARRPR
jgi:hypothetical protein